MGGWEGPEGPREASGLTPQAHPHILLDYADVTKTITRVTASPKGT